MGNIHILVSTNPPYQELQDLSEEIGALFSADVTFLSKAPAPPPHFSDDLSFIVIDQTSDSEVGDTFLKSLKLSKKMGFIPVIVLNKSGKLPLHVNGITIAADGYVSWPTDPKKAAQKIKKTINTFYQKIKEEGIVERVKFLVQSKLEFLFEVNNIISNLFSRIGLEEDQIINLRLTLDELGTNAIRHGNNGDPQKIVAIKCQFHDTFFSISIEDQGKGFNVTEIPDPTTTERILLPSGRGIFIARQLMDKVLFHGRGNKVEFRKEFPQKVQISAPD